MVLNALKFEIICSPFLSYSFEKALTINTNCLYNFYEYGQGFSNFKAMKSLSKGIRGSLKVMNSRLLRGYKNQNIDFQYIKQIKRFVTVNSYLRASKK